METFLLSLFQLREREKCPTLFSPLLNSFVDSRPTKAMTIHFGNIVALARAFVPLERLPADSFRLSPSVSFFLSLSVYGKPGSTESAIPDAASVPQRADRHRASASLGIILQRVYQGYP